MTASLGGTEVRLRNIRAHEGSQARAWEELAYQLRPPVGDGHLETRKTRAPDAGVEWYETYADGHQEGFQAKFHANLSDALSGMRESVAAVCSKRPNLTKLTFVVPYDFTDSGTADTKTDQDRWDDAVSRWRTDIPGAAEVEFTTIRAGDITSRLTSDQHAGRREYWFGGLELSDEWLQSRFAESVAVAGDRYTPEADSPSSINEVIDAASSGPGFWAELDMLIARVSAACRQDVGMWEDAAEPAAILLAQLDDVRVALSPRVGGDDHELPAEAPDITGIAGTAKGLLDICYAQWDNLSNYDRRNLDAAISAAQALQSLVTSEAADAYSRRAFALVGPAGQGKTHALMRAVDGHLKRGLPALMILGQRLSDKNWWPAIADTLDGLVATSEVFLQALDSMAEARQCRALVVFDAINESQSPKRWRDELPAMIALFGRFPHLGLIVSYRTDYRDVVGAPRELMEIHHPGLAGQEVAALAAYCDLFGMPVPSRGLYEPALSSPLFLRMYCEVAAADPTSRAEAPARSEMFSRYAAVVGQKVNAKLGLSPTSQIVSGALQHVADRILAADGHPVARLSIEQEVDALLPGRAWPNTLFQQMASEGVIELRPAFDGTESVGFPFQAYSEHLLANRLLASIERTSRSRIDALIPRRLREARWRSTLASRIVEAPWSWRSLAVTLPEKKGIELIDILPAKAADFRLKEAMRESLADRSPTAFGGRALALLRAGLFQDLRDYGSTVDTTLALAPRVAHPGNADWLHARLIELNLADRDASWSIATFAVDERSGAYRQLTRWAERHAASSDEDEARLAAVALMWLLTSPNRFLRDGTSKTLVKLLSQHLGVAALLIERSREVDDPYVQERVLTCAYGALLVAGDADRSGAVSLLEAVVAWSRVGLPIDVIARDSARGIGAWCVAQGLFGAESSATLEPPYGAPPAQEPPTREELEATHGPVEDADGSRTERRAASILHSCLDWYGDFNKYVVKSDVEYFSRYPLSGLAPSSNNRADSLRKVDVGWAGRWIASRAISLGWTAARFEEFELQHDLRRGRDAHKAERFGKKYQWIAHRELLARLADNVHPSFEWWGNTHRHYQGPWAWYGRDFDPTLPPSVIKDGSRVCRITNDDAATWAALPEPAMDVTASPEEWVAKTDDLPTAASMFSCVDLDGRTWVAIQRYSTWDRDNARRRGMYRRERDIFFLQFSWLVPSGKGAELHEFIDEEGLSGRWMPDARRMQDQYLGETSSAPIVLAEAGGVEEVPEKLGDIGIVPRPAVEQYVWEGNGLDCSIDETVDLYAPTSELLGDARWVGHSAAWSLNGRVVARAIEVPDNGNGQEVLLVDAEWLGKRLGDLDADLVIGTLSERHVLPEDDDDVRHMAFSDVWYVAYASCDGGGRESGPLLKVRGERDT